jgi:LysM repeat protein
VAQKRRGATGDPRSGGLARYAAPAAFLLAATIAILLVRAGLQGDATRSPATTRTVTTAPAKTTTKKQKPKPKPTTGASAFYTVAAGDTFGTIAAKNNTSVAELERLNPAVKSTSLFIGQKIRVK